MSATKQYSIVINGIKESTDAVDALMKQLDALEKRIDTLNNKGVSISKAVGGKTSDLSAEQKIADQINQSIEKRTALQGELGKQLAQEKQLMKEVNAEAKALAAKDRLDNAGYGNTMMGMKQELADIKAAMQVMDVSSNEFLQATQRADELNNKLKEIEQSYGQFGRNVGNYSGSIQEAFQQITVKVGDTEMKFNSTKEALRTLREGVKGMVVNGQEGTEEFKNMSDALHNLEMAADRADSAVQDLQKSSTGMDAALDWMQSFGALGQISQGFSTLFGGTGFEESIQKLMSLQSVLQGIEKIREQMNTGEGFGGMFGKASKSIDTFVAKLTGAKIGMNGLEASTKSATLAVKGLSLAIKAIGTAGVMIALDWLIDKLQEVGKLFGDVKNSAYDAANAMSIFKGELEQENLELENNIKLIDIKLAKGEITAEEAKKEKIEETNKALAEQLERMQHIIALNSDDNVYENMRTGMEDPSKLMDPEKLKQTTEMMEKLNEAVLQGKDVFHVMYDESGNVIDGLKALMTSADNTKERFVDANQTILGSFISMGSSIINHSGEYTEQEKELIQQLINAMNDGGLINNILMNLDTYLGDTAANFAPIIRSMAAQIRTIGGSLGLTGTESEEDRKKRLDKELADIKKHSTASVKTAKSTAKSTLDIEKETQKMRIQMMSEGIQKTIAQLNMERDEKLKKFKQNKQMEAEINRYYDNKILEERKKWAKKMDDAERELWLEIFNYNKQTLQMEGDYILDDLEREVDKIKNDKKYKINFYDIFFTETNSDFLKALEKGNIDLKEFGKNLEKLEKRTKTRRILMDYGFSFTEEQEESYQKLKKSVEDIYEKLKKVEGIDITTLAKTFSKLFSIDSLQTFKTNIWKFFEEWDNIIDVSEQSLKRYYQKRREIISAETTAELAEVEKWQEKEAEDARKIYDDTINNISEKDKDAKQKRKNAAEKFFNEMHRIEAEAKIRSAAITEAKGNEELKLEKEEKQKLQDLYEQKYSKELDMYSDYMSHLNEIFEQQPKRNAWGFIDVKETNKTNQIVLDGAKALLNELVKTQNEIQEMYDAGEMDEETYRKLMGDIILQINDLNKTITTTKANLSWEGKLQDFFQTFQQYYSAFASSIQQVWGEIDNLLNYDLDRQQDALDKENEILQKKLDEQEEILERHRQRVEDIEGKLSEARGDRREALIDALNAEILAQRRAQAEKERLEKQQERLEEKQKELDFQRELNQYYAGLRGILFNTAQAVMSAAANNWPLPAIPLMAAAGAAGAVQYALAARQRPVKKAEGGLISGPSHANGGVPVGNTGIEVEGNEYVIRKSSTEDNIQLLDYINSSQRKLNLSDFIDFFKNDKRTFMNNTSKTRFADGGMLELADNSQFSLGSAFRAYSDRPIVVSVVDINQRQAEVRQVEVLSGMNR